MHGGYRPGAGRKPKNALPPTPEERERHREAVETWRTARQPDDELRAALRALSAAQHRVALAARRLIEKAAR